MNFNIFYGDTFIPELPKMLNKNFSTVQKGMDVFYDASLGVLLKPLTTTGKVQAANGQFVTVVVDNLVVKNQFTNLYDNNTTADYNFYKTYISDAEITRSAIDPSLSLWPYENPAYKFIDVNKPYYKIRNDSSILYLQNDNLSQIVGIILDPSLVSPTNKFRIALDPSGTLITADPSAINTFYMEFVCTAYDVSYGPTWTQYKYGISQAGSGGGGGTVGPGTIDTISRFDTTNTIGDSPLKMVGNTLKTYGIDTSTRVNIDASISQFGKEVTKYLTSLSPDTKTPVAVGGIPADTSVATLKGMTYEILWDTLLFPSVAPTLVAPDFAFTDNVASLLEIGSTISGTFTSIFDRGAILNGAVFQDYRSGLPNQYTFTDPSNNTLLIDASSSTLSNIQTINGYLVKIGTQTFTGKVYYDVGPQPLDNKGNASDSPLAPGSIGPTSTTFEGVYPLWATTSNITTPSPQAAVSMLAGNSIELTLVDEAGGQKQKFEIPTAWTGAPTNRPLVGVQQYNTIAHAWEYPGGTAGSSLLLWNTSSVNETVQGNSIPYTRFTYNNPAGRNSVQIMLMF